MCRRQLLIGKQADVGIHPSWLCDSPEHNLMKWETTVRSRSAKKNGQLGVVQTGQSKELIPWNQEDEKLRLLREALSNTPFIRLGEWEIQPPFPEALPAPFPRHALPQGGTI